VSNGGGFEFYNSTIKDNKALSSSVTEIVSSPLKVIIDNCKITNNEIISTDQLNTGILPYIKNSSFSDYIMTNSYLFKNASQSS